MVSNDHVVGVALRGQFSEQYFFSTKMEGGGRGVGGFNQTS